MSWVNDLASILGVPGGAATLAIAFYTACSAAEKSARPEALKEIGTILKEPVGSQTNIVIDRTFRWTFGATHLSWKCVWRSAVCTAIFNAVLTVILHGPLKVPLTLINAEVIPLLHDAVGIMRAVGILATSALLFCFIPDYISLWKTRLTLHYCRKTSGVAVTLGILVLDICLSIFISVVMLIFFKWVAASIFHGLVGAWPEPSVEEDRGVMELMHLGFAYDMFQWLKAHGLVSDFAVHTTVYAIFLIGGQFLDQSFKADPAFAAAFLSTLMTSVWLFLAFASTLAIKIIVPTQRITVRFFDVEAHPLKAIGMVSGFITVAVTFVWMTMGALGRVLN